MVYIRSVSTPAITPRRPRAARPRRLASYNSSPSASVKHVFYTSHSLTACQIPTFPRETSRVPTQSQRGEAPTQVCPRAPRLPPPPPPPPPTHAPPPPPLAPRLSPPAPPDSSLEATEDYYYTVEEGCLPSKNPRGGARPQVSACRTTAAAAAAAAAARARTPATPTHSSPPRYR